MDVKRSQLSFDPISSKLQARSSRAYVSGEHDSVVAFVKSDWLDCESMLLVVSFECLVSLHVTQRRGSMS